MINWEVATIVAAGLAACVGYAFGRLSRVDTQYPHPKPPAPKKTTQPYRDPVAPVGDESPPPTKQRLFRYQTHDDKYVGLCCPACGAMVREMPVCDCTDVDSGSNVHFHVTCVNCSLRFAMETRNASIERRAKEKAREKAEAEKPKAN